MPTIGLLNVDVGDSGIGPFLGRRVGPFSVSVALDYQDRWQRLYRPERRVESIDLMTGQRRIESLPRTAGEWVMTASAEISDEDLATQESLLADQPIADGGVLDLCRILTFLSGRQVFPCEYQTELADAHARLAAWRHHYTLSHAGARACEPGNLLEAAQVVWPGRHALVEADLQQALFLHNETLAHNLIEINAGLSNTALDILVGHHSPDRIPANNDPRPAIGQAVEAALRSVGQLDADTRDAYIAILRARIQQGPSSALENLIAALISLRLIPEAPDESVLRRVRYMNSIRNAFVHRGRWHRLGGLDLAQSGRYMIAIVDGVLPALNQVMLSAILGLDGRFSLLANDPVQALRAYFSRGEWRTWRLEDQTYEEWFATPNAFLG